MAIIQIEHVYETDNPREAIERIGDERFVRAQLADVLNESARLGAQSAQIYAPEGATRKLKRHIDWSRAHPAIAGELVAEAGIKPIEGEEDPGRGAYPEGGTGVHGPTGLPIRPTSGRFMVFEIGGRKIVTTRVLGQKAQHFVREAYHDVLEYLPQRLAQMARTIAEGR